MSKYSRVGAVSRAIGLCLSGLVLAWVDLGWSTDITLAWDPNPDSHVAGYRVRYGTESGTYPNVIEVGPDTSVTITGLTPGTQYFSVVTAYNFFNLESTPSGEISFTAPRPPKLSDSDNDGLSDLFETTYGGGNDIAPFSDLNRDGLVALAEFVHGLDPNAPINKPIASMQFVEVDGKEYLQIRYTLNPMALKFVDIQIERTTDLANWHSGETLRISSNPSAENPNHIEIIEQSIYPRSEQRAEFIRFAHSVRSP